MRKFLIVCAAVLVASLSFVSVASAQDTHFGTVEADPASVPAAGEYTLTANGSDWLPDTSILLTSCVSPADTLIPGVSELDEIVAAGGAIEALTHCDLASAVAIDVDGDGNFSAELTATVGDNFFLSAGALDGSQAGAAWVPIVAAQVTLADTGLETGLLAVVGAAILGAGVMIAREARRH